MDEREREIQRLTEETARILTERQRMDQQIDQLLDRIQELKQQPHKPRRHLRALPGGVAALGSAAAVAWNRAATHPTALSAIVAAGAFAVASLLWVPSTDNDSSSPPMALPPSSTSAPSTPSSTTEPPSTTQRSLPPDVGNAGPTTVPQWTPTPVAGVERNTPDAQPRVRQNTAPEPPAESPAESPNEINESQPPPPEPPQEQPDSPDSPAPRQPPDCTGLHVDVSPVAEACALGGSLLEAEVLGG